MYYDYKSQRIKKIIQYLINLKFFREKRLHFLSFRMNGTNWLLNRKNHMDTMERMSKDLIYYMFLLFIPWILYSSRLGASNSVSDFSVLSIPTDAQNVSCLGLSVRNIWVGYFQPSVVSIYAMNKMKIDSIDRLFLYSILILFGKIKIWLNLRWIN